MRILELCQLYSPYIGGAEYHLKAITQEFIKQGHEVTIMTGDPSWNLPKIESDKNFLLQRFGALAPKGLYWFTPTMLLSALKKNNYDIIHVNAFQSYQTLERYILKKIYKKPLFITPHSAYYTGRELFHSLYFPSFGRTIIKNTNHIFLVSKIEELVMKRIFRVLKDTDSYSFIRNGADDKLFQLPLHTITDVLNVVYLGRLDSGAKNFQFIIEMLPKLVKSNSINLTIIGDGELKQELLSKINILKTPGNIHYLGKILDRNRLATILGKQDLAILPSRYESHPVAAIECLAAGIPVISSNILGLRQIIKNGKNGILVELPLSSEKFYEKLIFLNSHREIIQNMKSETKNSVDLYRWKNVAEIYLKYYYKSLKA